MLVKRLTPYFIRLSSHDLKLQRGFANIKSLSSSTSVLVGSDQDSRWRNYRRFSTNQSQAESESEKKQDQKKVRRAYAVGGCLMFVWLSTHGILLYRRRSEYRALNDRLPPISWNQFKDEYLTQGKVKSIVFQPHFEVGNVYLHDYNEQQMKKVVRDLFRATPDKFSRPPDVRFFYEGGAKEVESAILAAQKSVAQSGGTVHEVEFEIDQFPSYRELAFIMASTVFTFAAVTLMK